jgi:hypothetical protein
MSTATCGPVQRHPAPQHVPKHRRVGDAPPHAFVVREYPLDGQHCARGDEGQHDRRHPRPAAAPLADNGCAGELARKCVELAALRIQVERLTAALSEQLAPRPAGSSPAAGVRDLAAERVALFRSLFVGREDVLRAAVGEGRPHGPLTDGVIRDHLSGKVSIGLYPMLTDDICRLLACDFDGEQWQLDAQAYVQAADSAGVPTAVEVSRSRQGAHVWIFFTEPVPALDARAIGFGLLREAMTVRGELGLDSYDRFLPSQDYLPSREKGSAT